MKIIAEMEVQVYKTSVSKDQVKNLEPLLDKIIGKGSWNFALDDCDRILRMEADRTMALRVAMVLHSYGFQCEELEN